MEYLLKRYKKLYQKERKGFTLVELLVVIAILAVLASVSVVGYLGFTTKAKNSNALTELTQAKEVIRAELIGGSQSYKISSGKGIVKKDSAGENSESVSTTPIYTIAFTYAKDDDKMELKYTVKTSESADSTVTITWDDVIKACFTDLSGLGGKFSVDNSASSGTISSITYTNNSVNACWTIDGDKIANSESAGNNESTEVTASKTVTTTEQE